MRCSRIAFLATLAGLSIAHAAAPEPDTVYVVGEATVTVEPQYCVLTAELRQEGDDYPRVYSALQARAAIILKDARELGVADGDIDASKVERMTLQYEKGKQRTRLLRTLKVSVRDLQKCIRLVDRVIVMMGVESLDLRFEAANVVEVERAVMVKAADDAQKQADLLAKSLGRTLGRALAISQEKFGTIESRFGGTQSPWEADRAAPAFVAPTDGNTFRVPSYIEFTRRLYVLFQLQP